MLSKDQIKKQAQTLQSELSKLQAIVKYQDALEVLAKINGYRSWQAMSALLEPASAKDKDTHPPRYTASLEPHRTAIKTPYGTSAQSEIPGTGFLYRVPVAVDTSMSATVLVRARDRGEAISRAKELVIDGKALLEVDEGNYRGASDYYCPDSSDEGVHRVQEFKAAPSSMDEYGIQVGPFLVQLSEIGEDELLWADMSVFVPGEEEPMQVSCASKVEVALPSEVADMFCRDIAGFFAATVRDVSKLDQRTFQHAFYCLAQGDDTPELREELRRVLAQ